MEFRPIQAACIFGAAMLLPAIPFWLIKGTQEPFMSSVLLASGVVSAVLFGTGAKLAATPHRIKSLIISVLATWLLTHSLNALVEYVPLASEMHKAILAAVLSFAFIFLAGWRFAPRAPTPVHG
ncbi:MAG TPA: hypothetical protein VFK24_04845 [Gammaproteobacteria bacterium]|nr:hypothetical protein [Gammaproteobacteria bacterium]